MPSSADVDAAPRPARGVTRLAQAAPDASAPAPTAPAQAAADEPIGNVVTLAGSATVTRNNVATPLKLKDDILLNDVVQTAAGSKLGITFNDATTFNLSANSTVTIDNYIYQDGGKDNAGVFDIGKGVVAFVAAAVAKTGDMKITTPTATMGIRGTTGVVEVPENASATNANNVAIKLYPDPDGHVGRIEVNDRAGARLGALTLGASGFTIRPGMGGGRVIAAPLAISVQQARRDQGFVRELHAAQRTGRQIVTQQRALRRANPIRNNPSPSAAAAAAERIARTAGTTAAAGCSQPAGPTATADEAAAARRAAARPRSARCSAATGLAAAAGRAAASRARARSRAAASAAARPAQQARGGTAAWRAEEAAAGGAAALGHDW